MKQPRALGEFIDAALATERLRRAVLLERLRLVWPELVGGAVAQRTRLGLSGSDLVVACGDDACRELLETGRADLQRRLRKLSSGALKNLRLVEREA